MGGPTRVTGRPWVRKHDPPGHPVVADAPVVVFPQTLEELVDLCAHHDPAQRLHASGSHWALSEAALSDHVFIETNDPADQHPGLDRTLRTVVPGCLTDAYVEHLAAAGAEDGRLRYPFHVEAGKRIYQAYAELDLGDAGVPDSLARRLADEHGTDAYLGSWAFPTLGGAGGQTVVGAATTGTHGGDFTRPPLADCLLALHVVLDGGRHVWIERPATDGVPQLTDDAKLHALYGTDRYGGPANFSVVRDADTFDAALVSVGRFGVVYSAVVEAVPQYGLHERRRLTTWQEVRHLVGDPSSALFRDDDAGPGGQRFLQVAVCLTPRADDENLAGVTRRWDVTPPTDPDTGEPAGRAQRRGPVESDAGDGRPRFRSAGTDYPYTPDPDRPGAADEPSLLLRASSNPDVVLGAAEAVIADLEEMVQEHDHDGGSGLRRVLEAVGDALQQHARRRTTVGEVFDGLRGVLLGWDDGPFLAAGLHVWRAVVNKVFESQQVDLDYEAISYAVMDGHNYRDLSSNVNVESVEVFFDATDPELVEFVDGLLAFQRAQEEQRGRSFAGYASLRFTGPTRALLGPQLAACTCAVEVAGLADLDGSSAVVEHAEQWALRPESNAVLHWGQRNHATAEAVEAKLTRLGDGGNRLARWRSVLAALTDDGRLDGFSNAFTRATGLEVPP